MEEMHKVRMERLFKSKTDRQSRISGWNQEMLNGATVFVAGAGATGNELIKNLMLSGVRYAFIADMDRIEVTNLSRTVLFDEANLGDYKATIAARQFIDRNVNDNACADAFVGNIMTELGTGVLNHVDVVIGCLDNLQTRFELSRRCKLVGKPYIDCGISGLKASVTCLSGAPEKPCIACKYGKRRADELSGMVRNSCTGAAKDLLNDGIIPTSQVASAIAAGIQSKEVLKCLHHIKCGTMNWEHSKMYMLTEDNFFMKAEIPYNHKCEDHFHFDDVVQSPMSCDWKLIEALEYVREHFGNGYRLTVDNDDRYRCAGYGEIYHCLNCGKEIDLFMPAYEVTHDKLFCADCEHVMKMPAVNRGARLVFSFNECCSHLWDKTLKELGIPPLHILVFENEDAKKPEVYIELTGDLQTIMPNLPATDD